MIRRVTAADIDDAAWRESVVKLAEDFFNEAQLPGSFRKGSFFACWRSHLLAGTGVLLCADTVPDIAGLIGGVIVPSAVTGDIFLTEAFWFVRKDSRGVTGLKLLMAFIEAAKELKVDHVTMAHMHFALSEKAEQVYEKFGFRKLETHYILTL